MNSQPDLQTSSHELALPTRANKWAIALVAVILAIVMLSEVGLRLVCGPGSQAPLPYRNPTNLFHIDYRKQNLYIMPNYMPVTPGSTKRHRRIVFTGGSGAVGSGCITFQSFPSYVQRELYKHGHSTEVVNAALEGSDSTSYTDLVTSQDLLGKLNPDVLVIYTGTNEYLRLRAYKHIHPEWSAESEAARAKLEISALYRWLNEVWFRANTVASQRVEMADIPDNIVPADYPIVENYYRHNMLLIANKCRERNIKFVILPYFCNEEADQIFYIPSLNGIMQEVARQTGATYVDLERELRAGGYSPDYDLFADFGHFAPKGAEVVGQLIYAALEREKLLDKPNMTPIIPDQDPLNLETFAALPGLGGLCRTVQYADEILNKAPSENTVLGLTLRGHVSYLENSCQEAVDYYTRASKLAPDSAYLYRNLGHAYCRLQQYEQALDCYAKFLRLSKGRLKDPYLTNLMEVVNKTRENAH